MSAISSSLSSSAEHSIQSLLKPEGATRPPIANPLQQGSLDGVTIDSVPASSVAALSKLHYRLNENNQWEERNSTTEEWALTDRFDAPQPNNKDDNKDKQAIWKTVYSIHQDDFVLHPFICQHNRLDTITTRQKAYKEELARLEKDSSDSSKTPMSEDRKFVLSSLVKVLEKAAAYQGNMIQHLVESKLLKDSQTNQPSKKPGVIALHDAHLFEASMKINDRPNKIERIADQIERIYALWTLHQLALDVALSRNMNSEFNNEVRLKELSEIKTKIKDNMDALRTIIQKNVDYAKALPPPYEKLDASAKEKIENLARNCSLTFTDLNLLIIMTGSVGYPLRERFFRLLQNRAKQQQNLEIQRGKPRQQVIDLYTEAEKRYHYAVTTLDSSDFISAWAFENAAVEAQNPAPRKDAIDCYVRAGLLEAQLIGAANQVKDHYDECSSWAFENAAVEAQNPAPRQQVIDLYIQIAVRYQEISEEKDHKKEYYCLKPLIENLEAAVIEAKKPVPRQQVIDLYTQAVARYRKVADDNLTMDEFDPLARTLTKAALEAEKPVPRYDVLNSYMKEIDRLQKDS